MLETLPHCGITYYKLQPIIKDQLIVRAFALMCEYGYTQSYHAKLRGSLHLVLVANYAKEPADALLQTANDIVAHARNKWEAWEKNGSGQHGPHLADVPESLHSLFNAAFSRIETEKRAKAEKIGVIIRKHLFGGPEAANKIAIEHAKEITAVIDAAFLTKTEKEEIKRCSERMLKDARGCIASAMQHGKKMDFAAYSLDRQTEDLVKHYGEAAKMLREGKRKELLAGIEKKKAYFERWEGKELVLALLMNGVPEMPKISDTQIETETDPFQ